MLRPFGRKKLSRGWLIAIILFVLFVRNGSGDMFQGWRLDRVQSHLGGWLGRLHTDIIDDDRIEPSDNDYQIEVDLTAQEVRLFVEDELVELFAASTGRAGFETQLGTYIVAEKAPKKQNDDLVWTYTHWFELRSAAGVKIGLAAMPTDELGEPVWRGYLGIPVTLGNIILAPKDAARLYELIEIGTPVLIKEND